MNSLGVRFAAPAIPDVSKLASCRTSSSTEKQFMECALGGLPAPYRVTQACFDANQDDLAAALFCSSNNSTLANGYQRFNEVKACFENGDRSDLETAACLSQPYLGTNERQYLQCLTANTTSSGTAWGAAAACAIAKDANPEIQIAIACAVASGGEPMTFAACTGGALTKRELEKCWTGGIATNDGCFGPNNEFRKFANSMNNWVQERFGTNSVAAQVYGAWHNNVLAPGPNGEVVKFLNNGLSDLQKGPGSNNEIVKVGRKMEEGVRSVGRMIGL